MSDHRRGPWRLGPNRVRRFYRGGALLDPFRAGGGMPGVDGHEPEDWLGSATRSWTPPGAEPADEGLSVVDVDGRERTVLELLIEDPEDVGGGELLRATGMPSTGILVKLLDPAQRLPVHAHPSRAFARTHLASWFGKTEAWLILGTRQRDAEPPPMLHLGLREDVPAATLRSWIEEARSDELLGAMHQRPARPGDAWLVPAGTPHAIDGGILILEVQEPTDFSIVAETRGVPIDRADASLRLGWDTALDAVDRRLRSDRDVDELRFVPGPPPIAGALTRARLLPPAADPFFRAERWTIAGPWPPLRETSFLVGVVTAGAGEATVRKGGRLELRQGMAFAVPAASLPQLDLHGEGLQLVACLGPRADDVRRGAG